MSRRAAVSQADLSRAIKGAIKGGLPVGSFKVVVENGTYTILPADPITPPPSANDAEDAWDRAVGLK